MRGAKEILKNRVNIRPFAKLFAAAVSLVIAVLLAATATYAWMTLSVNPSLSEASITIGGRRFLLLANSYSPDAPDPFAGFKSSLTISSPAGKLLPVSTADGINWIIKENGGYVVDDDLSYANVSNGETGGPGGGYVYFDVWVMSPVGDVALRLSRGDAGQQRGARAGGTYLLAKSNGTGVNGDEISRSARVGFLTEDSFAIYEPNGTSHASPDNGKYIATRPLGFEGTAQRTPENVISLTDLSDRLIVQAAGAWTSGGTPLPGKFVKDTGALFGRILPDEGGVQPVEGSYFNDNTLGGAAEDVIVTRLERNKPKMIRVFVWIESEDPDCPDNFITGNMSLELNLEFSSDELSAETHSGNGG
ncbi:MAG: hypothetical protein IJU75_05740 [Clostridia bacterium]|nr:hypothetical protein [Clostridia bacterium]